MYGAYFIPVIELVVGLMLIVGLWLHVAWGLYFGLLLVFDAALLFAYFNDLDIVCGCFGEGASQGVSEFKLLQNLGLTIGSAWAFIYTSKEDVMYSIDQ